MRTASIIAGIILAVVASCLAVLAGLAFWLGLWVGLGAGVVLAAVVLLAGGLVFQPWQHRWGATDAEVAAVMPGDEVIPGAGVTTRAVTIEARPGQVWPWLAQIGWGRAGWYSYDWLDNDGRPSANHVVADLQDLRVGDRILMTPGMGPGSASCTPALCSWPGTRRAAHGVCPCARRARIAPAW
ncbi:hypothetical protein FHS43_006928 [Streptosporangium becharense]|uniref:Uncharacterized protein n=1 Tax=Streptosporangium becharense TaxID=1816182 RepID=A0A7W9ME36_9ACTN|nr:hypothetical protein [Streptosporangium becharense]MBB2915605.1 hypothetical protein [Streptosporangium becharense]MBB5817046.1 hypothetical protein [Streptosporangium becharense]